MKSIEAQYDMNPEELAEVMRDTNAKLRVRARDIARGFFYSDEGDPDDEDDYGTAWEPFDCYPTNWILEQMQDLEDVVYYAMLWARDQ